MGGAHAAKRLNREKGKRMEAVAHKTPALQQQRDRAQKRGFSLIEAAIVLGVVGAVIGGIWYSAAAMYENYKVNKTVEGIFSTARNVQNLISLKDSESLGVNQLMNDFLIESNSIPSEWIKNGTIKTPLDSGFYFFAHPVALDTHFVIGIEGISKSACISVVVDSSTIAAHARMKNPSVWDNSGNLNLINTTNPIGYFDNNFPVSPDMANSICADGITIQFYFGYTRIN